MVLTPVGGLGDDAYYLAVSDQVGLVVKKGGLAFKVAVYQHGPLGPKQTAERTLAGKIVPSCEPCSPPPRASLLRLKIWSVRSLLPHNRPSQKSQFHESMYGRCACEGSSNGHAPIFLSCFPAR